MLTKASFSTTVLVTGDVTQCVQIGWGWNYFYYHFCLVAVCDDDSDFWGFYGVRTLSEYLASCLTMNPQLGWQYFHSWKCSFQSRKEQHLKRYVSECAQDCKVCAVLHTISTVTLAYVIADFGRFGLLSDCL